MERIVKLLLVSIFACLLFWNMGCNEGLEIFDNSGDASIQDTDNDTIADTHEGEEDADGDGTPNYLDADSDGDCIPDSLEAGDSDPFTYPVDSDNDGTPDYLDSDSDDNGVPDSSEVGRNCNTPVDTDGDGTPDFIDEDNDGDGISDEIELGEDPNRPDDSDSDHTPDYMDTDSDNDGIPDVVEASSGGIGEVPVDSDHDGTPDYLDLDSDNDGLDDASEKGDNPLNPLDTDGDGSYDYVDTDSDGDGLSDTDEVDAGTSPTNPDTDGDGYSDAVEIYAQSDPLSSDSFPDGYVFDVTPRTISEYAVSFTLDELLLDVFLLIDQPYYYTIDSGCSHYTYYPPDPRGFVASLIANLFAHFEDITVGLGYYDDFQGYGACSGGKPFTLSYQQTTSYSNLMSVLPSSFSCYNTSNSYGSTIEALYQVATGYGFDYYDNNVYDSSYDVYPFVSSSSDAFAGSVGGVYNSSVPGTGILAGTGFRDGALPVIVYTADRYIRDPDDGESTPSGAAGESAAVSALNYIGAKLIGVNSYYNTSYGGTVSSELTQIANETNSYYDSTGTGTLNAAAVFDASSSWPSVSQIIDIIEDWIYAASSYTLDIEVTQDEKGLISSISPSTFTDTPMGSTISFVVEITVNFQPAEDSEVFETVLSVVREDGITVGEITLYIVVERSAFRLPGRPVF